jgi:hypothetical protein
MVDQHNNPDPSGLRPATDAEIGEALAYALRFRLGKRVHASDDFMAQVAAAWLVEHLRSAGFVIMKGLPIPRHTAGG